MAPSKGGMAADGGRGNKGRGSLKTPPQVPAELQILATTSDWAGTAAGGGRRSRSPRCCLSCLRLFASVVFSALGTVCLLLLYVLGCAVIFNSIEKNEAGGGGGMLNGKITNKDKTCRYLRWFFICLPVKIWKNEGKELL